MTDGPSAALGCWIKIKERWIENGQCVVPKTWNDRLRDIAGNIGAFDARLMDTTVERPEALVEILWPIHSFDLCLACLTHVMSPDGRELARVKGR